MKYITFVDTETTGLDPSQHEIIEIAAVRTLQDFTIIEAFSAKVKPQKSIASADKKALQVNRYSDEVWVDAIDREEALTRLFILMQDSTLAGHNVSFDIAFIQAAYNAEGMDLPKMDYHRLDTVNLAWPLKAAGLVETLSLEPLCEYLGIPTTDAHSALADAMASRAVALRLIPVFADALLPKVEFDSNSLDAVYDRAKEMVWKED